MPQAAIDAFQKTINKVFIKDLEESLRRIARRIGWKKLRELKEILRHKDSLEEDRA